MTNILDIIETPYIDCQILLAHLNEYRNPRDRIARMVKKGELIRLKNGFFLIASRFRRGNIGYPYEQIANLLYGPSYISLEWALSFYGFIPERVTMITSVTTGSNKEFQTPIGTFSYRHLGKSRYSVGIDHSAIFGQLGGFLIATPEKALVDWIFFTCDPMTKDELFQELTVSKRVEIDKLKSLDIELAQEICNKYRSANIKHLLSILGEL